MQLLYGGRPGDEAIFSGSDWSTKLASISDGLSNTTLILESRVEKTSPNYGGYWGQGVWSSTHAIVYDPNPANKGAWSQYWTCGLPNAPHRSGQTAVNPRRLGYSWSNSSLHPGGVNVAFADGSIQFVKNSVNAVAWHAVQTMKERRNRQQRRVLIDPSAWDVLRDVRTEPSCQGYEMGDSTMMITHATLLAVAGMVLISGCGGEAGPKRIPVTGVVTYNGKPLEGPS